MITPKAIIKVDKKINDSLGTLKMLSDKAGIAVLKRPSKIPTNITCRSKFTNNEYFFSAIIMFHINNYLRTRLDEMGHNRHFFFRHGWHVTRSIL